MYSCLNKEELEKVLVVNLRHTIAMLTDLLTMDPDYKYKKIYNELNSVLVRSQIKEEVK